MEIKRNDYESKTSKYLALGGAALVLAGASVAAEVSLHEEPLLIGTAVGLVAAYACLKKGAAEYAKSEMWSSNSSSQDKVS